MGKYRYNRYRDVEIDVSRFEWDDHDTFVRMVTREFDKWSSRLTRSKEKDNAVMWVNVPKCCSRVVPWLLSITPPFHIHHANSSRIMMVRPNDPMSDMSQVPSYGTHYVKVDCMVLEENTGRVLMVRERVGHEVQPLKLVTGAAEAGEFFSEAAEREVYEETGIRARFHSVQGIANRRTTRFDRDEIVFSCILYAAEGQKPIPDGKEVNEASWHDGPPSSKEVCTMTEVWLGSVANTNPSQSFARHRRQDVFRRGGHLMDFYVPY